MEEIIKPTRGRKRRHRSLGLAVAALVAIGGGLTQCNPGYPAAPLDVSATACDGYARAGFPIDCAAATLGYLSPVTPRGAVNTPAAFIPAGFGQTRVMRRSNLGVPTARERQSCVDIVSVVYQNPARSWDLGLAQYACNVLVDGYFGPNQGTYQWVQATQAGIGW